MIGLIAWMLVIQEIGILFIRIFKKLPVIAFRLDFNQIIVILKDYETIWNFHTAPIAEKGQRTEVYDRIAEINHEVQSLSKVFLGAKVIKLRHTGENIPMGTTALTASALPKQILKVEADGEGVLVSHLKNGNRQYLMIVIRDIYQPQRVSVETAEGVMRIMPDGRELTAKTYSPSLYVEAGDMLLFGWKQE